MRKDIKIVIGIPTINSKAYICSTINKIKQEIKYCSNILELNNIKIVISVNGNIDSYNFINNIYKDDNQIIALFEKETGKNNSLNQIINYAKVNNIDIIHWFDDDLTIKEKTLKINLQKLIKNLDNNQPPQIVASTILRIKRSLRFFIKNNGFLKGIIHYYYYQIFSLPFEESSSHPNFCMGMSYGVLVKDIPLFPASSTSIADDGYIGNYYAILNKEKIINDSFLPIVHPKNSYTYFNVSTKLDEWLKQQQRIYVGVMYSYFIFNKDSDFLRNYFAWYYSHDIKSKNHKLTFFQKIRFIFYCLYQNKMKKKANYYLKNNKEIKWSTASSTKEFL